MASAPLPTKVKKSFLFFLLFMYTFVVSTLIINFLMVLTLLIWPFDRKLFRKINYILGYSSWSQFTCIAQWWSGCDIILYIDQKDRLFAGKEHILVLMNHTYEIDWLMLWILSERYGVLGGAKVYGKNMLRYIPLIGWAWYFTECIFLMRNWAKDKKIIADTIKELLDFPDQYWFTLLLFPEGTRFTPEKHEASLKFAREKGLPEFKHHLLPRTKGFSYTIQALQGKGAVGALYDIAMGFKGNTVKPTLMNAFRGNAITAHLRMKRYELEDLPKEEEELSQWLRDLFKEKDDLVDEYMKTGKFDLPEYRPPQRLHDLLNWIFWFLVTDIPLFYYLGSVLVAGTITQQLIVLGVVVFMTIFSRWMIGLSEIKRGSSYGSAVTHSGKKST
ncbi:1-acyl-sn-glycerol-3-phosphate acyltransferase delta-like isoform X2 [Mizuhopecten yessoensis]|uniref:1-acyl-sn-glycerol-3-phosphate acyltransferase delta n=1 Tax=Mizuhopecten yessoensis TaxID=6573 RepID=A0A210QB20_MIZYE|nr:1-acyl-sn-glycerol-3-phosphate acyltransferase delta-like isoform X2 [Mizuhopecten yessoensis]OWF45925.1 1-acyl-sn-glycerol-3-phosphate acyltransferase delta [Mizuhopecten yessoensis]